MTQRTRRHEKASSGLPYVLERRHTFELGKDNAKTVLPKCIGRDQQFAAPADTETTESGSWPGDAITCHCHRPAAIVLPALRMPVRAKRGALLARRLVRQCRVIPRVDRRSLARPGHRQSQQKAR